MALRVRSSKQPERNRTRRLLVGFSFVCQRSVLIFPDLHFQLKEIARITMETPGAPWRQPPPCENYEMFLTRVHCHPAVRNGYVTCVTVRSDIVHILLSC